MEARADRPRTLNLDFQTKPNNYSDHLLAYSRARKIVSIQLEIRKFENLKLETHK